MRYLGLDLGSKTLGMALSDPNGIIASSYKIIRHDEEYERLVEEVKNVVEKEKIEKIVLGLPKNMDGSEGFASARSLKFKEMIASITDIPVVLVDERLSTTLAENILLEADMSRKKRKKVIDGVAAVLILETLLKMEENK